MEILVRIKCSDQIIEVNLDQLLKHQYFQNALTERRFERTESIDDIGTKTIKCEWNIPQISVDCCSQVLKILLHGEYCVRPNNYDDKLIEIMLYNDKYKMRASIKNTTWGFNAEEYFDLIYFIKQKMPTVNPYDFVKKGGFNFSESFVHSSFKLYALNQLDEQVIPDLLPYLKKTILGKFWISQFPGFGILHVLDSIINACDLHRNIILTQINDLVIKTMLDNLLRDNSYFCENGSFQISSRDFRELYNKTIELTFERLRKLESYEIICLDKIGKMEDYLVRWTIYT